MKTYQLLKRGEKKRINLSCSQYHYYFLQKGYSVWAYVLKKPRVHILHRFIMKYLQINEMMFEIYSKIIQRVEGKEMGVEGKLKQIGHMLIAVETGGMGAW